MSDTTFSNGTVVQPAWLNDVNLAVYRNRNVSGFGMVNVKADPFNAKGDGVTDDTSAIQSAINSATTGGVVYFPAGTYLISSSLTVTTYGVRLMGGGTAALWNGASSNATSGSIILKSASMTSDAIVVTGGRFIGDTITVLGLAGNTGDGIYFKDTQNSVLSNVCVSMMGNDGIRIGAKSGSSGNCNGFQMYGCTTQKNGRHGLMLYDQSASGGPNANGGAITGLTTSFNTGDGVHNENGCFNTFTGLLSQQNTGFGVALVGTVSLSLYTTFCGGDIEANTAGNWSVGTNAKHNTWLGSFPNNPANLDPGQFNVQFGDGPSVARQIQFRQGGSALSTYDTGTWTPNDSSGASLSFTISGTPTYTRIGNIVNVSGYITYPTTASGANAIIGGLPYGSAAGTYAQCSLFTNYGQAINAYLVAGASSLEIRNTSAVNLTNANLSGKLVLINMTYTGA